MNGKIIIGFVLALLSLFGFRKFLPEIFSLILVSLFAISGVIGLYYYLRPPKNIRMMVH